MFSHTSLAAGNTHRDSDSTLSIEVPMIEPKVEIKQEELIEQKKRLQVFVGVCRIENKSAASGVGKPGLYLELKALQTTHDSTSDYCPILYDSDQVHGASIVRDVKEEPQECFAMNPGPLPGSLVPSIKEEPPEWRPNEDLQVKDEIEIGPTEIQPTNSTIKSQETQTHIETKCYNQYSCGFCSENFHSTTDYLAHRKIHTHFQRFSCNLCEKTFKQKSKLNIHVKEVHIGDKQFSCDYCGRSFTRKRSIIDHFKIHTDTKPFACTLCGKRFSRKGYVAVHMSVHQDKRIKPFECDVCGKRYSVYRSLSYHKRVHSSNLIFKCNKCDMSFADRNEWILHRRDDRIKERVDKQVSCHICKKTFSKNTMDVHLKTHEQPV